MKRPIEILRRLVAALAVLTAPSAAEAALKTLDANNSLLAFWPQFSEETLTSGSYTFSNFRSATLNNGIVTVDSTSGFAFSNSTDTATWSGSGTGITIMLNYSDFSVPSGNAVFMTTSLAGLHDSAIGLFSNSSGTTKGFWYNNSNGVGWSPSTNTYTETTLLASGAMFFEYDYDTANKDGTGVYVYNVASDNTDSEIYHATGLRSDKNVGKILHIGSSSHGNATWFRNEGLKVHSVAIFQRTLTAAERKAFALTRKLEVAADTDFANLTATSFTDLYGNATDWNAGTNLCINMPSTAADSVTLTLPSEGLNSGSLLHIQVAEGKTLVLSGSATADSIVVTGKGMVSCSAAGTLTGVVKGDGTVVYDLGNGATNPAATFNNAAWTGVLWIKNRAYAGFSINSFGSADSTLRLSNFNCFFSSKETANPMLDLEGEGLTVSNGNSQQVETIKKLTGSGTLTLSGGSADGNGFVVNDASEFYGAIQNTTAAGNARRYKVTIGASGTHGYDRNMIITSGYAANIADGKTWTMPGGLEVSGTLGFAGTGKAIGPVTTYSGAVLDLSAYTGETPAVSGELAPSANSTLLLPAGATLPYQVATSGDAMLAHFTYQIGDNAAVTGPVLFDDGALLADGVKTATLAGVNGVAQGTLFGTGAIEWTGSGNHYVLTLTAANSLLTVGDTTGVESLTIIVQNDGALYVSGELPENTTIEGLGALTVAENATADFYAEYTRLYSQIGTATTGNGAISTSGTTISVGSIQSVATTLSAGNYTLARWMTPQKLSTGYGYAANVSITSPATVASGCAYELVYMADRIVLRVYDTAAQTARGTLKIWPYGDSITEGFNSNDTTANYRVLLAQKLSLLGYNVEMVGCYDRVQSQSGTTTFYEAKDPSGQTVPAAWAKHSAKHGGTVGVTSVTSYQRSAMVENVDTLAAQAGSPDVVLFHGGINDLSVVSDANTVFANWTNVVWKLLDDLPNAKIVVSTTLYATYGSAGTLNPRSDSFNALVRAQVAKVEGTDDGAFPAGRVILADLNSIVQSTDDGILSGDKLHPDWWGHDQMAEGWLAAIKSIYSTSGPDSTFASASGLPAVASSDLGAAAKTELADYRKGFTRYGWFEATGAKDVSSITYSDVDSGAAASDITKVAYFVEYVRADNNAHKWVWVDMDAFGTTIADVGLPSATHQQAVTNLHVKSNHNGIEDVAADVDGVTGWIQFSPYDYSGAESGVSGAPTAHGGSGKAMFDWNNLISNEENVDSGTNACMQVFRVSPSSGRPAQTLFAYNNWRSTTLPAEFGIGNFAQHFWGGMQTLDYTYTRGTANKNFTSMNADAYTVKRIEIWTKGASEYITNDKKGGSTAYGNFSSETWQLTVPGTAGNFVKLDKVLLGLRSDNATEMAKRTVVRLTVSTAQGTVAVSDLMNGDGNAQTSTTFADGAYSQTFEFGEDCVLECGTAYTLTMIDSSGNANAVWPAWLEAYADAASYSPIANTVNLASNWRVAQSLYASKVRVATVSADLASSGALTFAPALPSDAREAALLVNVTADATLTLGAATTVGSIRFAVADGVTLTIADPANINAGEVVFYGPGRVAFTGEPNFGAADVEFAGSPTVALALGQTIATTGDVVIDKNASVTFEPATITDPTATLVAATSLANNGTIAVTAPDQGSDYSVAATATGVVLRRVTKEAFSYDAYPGGTGPTGWFESWGGEQLSTTSLRVGPSAAIPFVYHTSGSAHPWNALAARTSGVSLAVYADVSEMNSSKGVIAQFGNKSSGIFMYRDGNYVKVAKIVDSSITTPNWVPGVEVQSGFHLYTFTYNPATGAAALYLDDGSVSAATDGSADYAHLGTTALNDGFQIGATYQNNPSGFANGADMALCSVRGYDAVLAPQEVATLSESFPATDGTIDRHIVLGDSSNTQTLTVYSSAQKTGVSAILATNGGNIVIPAGEEVSVDRFRTFTDGTSKAANALTVNGTLNIANVDSTPDATCGIVLGWWLSPTDGARTSVVTVPAGGEIDASNAYFVIPYVNNMASATLNMSGGTVKTKGLYAYHPNSNSVLGHITISGGGVLELGEQVTAGKVIEKSFGYGTYRVKGTGEEKGSIAFTSANIAEPTTLDPYGCTLTLSGMTGAGYITVADSSTAGNGQVVFSAQGSFTGAIILTDDNAKNMDISAYTGKIVLRGTAAETIAKLGGYTGIVIIDQAGTYDVRSIDLSAATMQIAHASAVVNATAGKEGNVSVVVGTCNLYADNNTFLYDGHVFAGGVNSVGATLNYIHSEAYSVSPLSWEIGAAFSAEELAEVQSGNNIAPYFKIFVGHEDGDDIAGSLATATDWNGHAANDEVPTSGNMAIRVSDGKTLTVEVPSAVSFGEVQVFGSGSVVFTGEAALTVTKGMYVTPGTTVEANGTNLAFTGDGNPGIHVDYGLTEAASGKAVLADGTAQSPYAPYIYGQGAVEVPAGAVASLANQQNAISYLTVDGTATAAASSTALAALSALTVSATGVLDVPAGATVSPVTLTVNGTMNMASTAALSGVTTLGGAGTVVWNEKNPDLATSSGIWTSSTWSGTNYIRNITAEAERPVYYWGRNGSYVKLENVKGWLAHDVVINAEVVLANGNGSHGLEISNGNTQDAPTYFRKLSGNGTLKQTGTGGNQRYVLRDVSDFTGSIEKTDTVRVLIIDATTYQASLPARNDNGGKMFVANITAKIGDGNSWSVKSGKTIDIAGTATVELLGAASITGATTIGGGATLTFDDIGTSESPKKLTLNSAVTVASADTVNIAFGDGVDTSDLVGTTLISWGGAPEGEFAFADSSLADNYYLVKTASGLEVAQWGVVTLTTDANVTSIRGVTNGYKVKPGDTVSFTVATADGYDAVVTVGNEPLTANNGTYSYTVEGNVTITVTTVSTSLTIEAATVEYLADYSKAKTVSATVTAGTVLEGTTWTLKTNGVAVVGATGTYANGTVTFSNISVTLGDSITYSIEASNGSTGTSAKSAASTVGNVTDGWIVENSTHTGNDATGRWATDITYNDGVATITDANTYTPNKTGDGIVTLETVVKFGNEADPEVAVGDGAQAAVKIANGKFAVYGKTASDGTAGWQSIEVASDVDATYTVKLVINYNTGTFTISVKKNDAETATPLGDTWYLATAATKVSSIAYKGTGAFTSLNGSFISGDVDVSVDETGVAVSSDFIGRYLGTKTVSEATELLAPNSAATCSNGYNYFTNYALGLDPTKEEDKPIVDMTVVNGNYVFKVKHPVYNEQGAIAGYEEIDAADNVSTTVTLKYGTDADTQSWTSAVGTSFAPNALPFDENNNVLYYKAEVSIDAK